MRERGKVKKVRDGVQDKIKERRRGRKRKGEGSRRREGGSKG